MIETPKLHRLPFRLNPLALLPSTDCGSFSVCEAHLELFNDVDGALRKKTKCVGCNNTADRAANWKSSITLSLIHSTSIPIGSAICSTCNKASAEGEDELMTFIQQEHRYRVISPFHNVNHG